MSADTRLREAAQRGDVAVARDAVACGADVNARDQFEQTVLCWAILNGHTDVAKVLLENGADPNLRGAMTSPLAAAASQGQQELVELLLSMGAAVDDNACILAQINDHHAIVARLETAKANPVAAPPPRAPVAVAKILTAAIAGDLAGVEQALADGESVDTQDSAGTTALMNAAGSGHTELVKALLAKGARTDLVERRMGANALLAAAIAGNAETLGLLLDAGMDVAFANEDGFSALTYCAARGDTASVSLLLARGAPVDHANNYGETPLLRAAGAGHADAARLLLDAGANIDHASNERFTALMLAADKGHLEVVRVLLERGADQTAVSLALKRAHDYARIAGHTEIHDLLKPPDKVIPKLTLRSVSPDETSVQNKRLTDAIWGKDFDQAVSALESGATLAGEGDDIPLILAAHSGSTDIVRLLLENGAPVDAADSIGLTALCKACGGCYVDMARALLEKGATITADVRMCAGIHAHPGIMALLEKGPQ
jgi:uncharacterized protein